MQTAAAASSGAWMHGVTIGLAAPLQMQGSHLPYRPDPYELISDTIEIRRR